MMKVEVRLDRPATPTRTAADRANEKRDTHERQLSGDSEPGVPAAAAGSRRRRFLPHLDRQSMRSAGSRVPSQQEQYVHRADSNGGSTTKLLKKLICKKVRVTEDYDKLEAINSFSTDSTRSDQEDVDSVRREHLPSFVGQMDQAGAKPKIYNSFLSTEVEFYDKTRATDPKTVAPSRKPDRRSKDEIINEVLAKLKVDRARLKAVQRSRASNRSPAAGTSRNDARGHRAVSGADRSSSKDRTGPPRIRGFAMDPDAAARQRSSIARKHAAPLSRNETLPLQKTTKHVSPQPEPRRARFADTDHPVSMQNRTSSGQSGSTRDTERSDGHRPEEDSSYFSTSTSSWTNSRMVQHTDDDSVFASLESNDASSALQSDRSRSTYATDNRTSAVCRYSDGWWDALLPDDDDECTTYSDGSSRSGGTSCTGTDMFSTVTGRTGASSYSGTDVFSTVTSRTEVSSYSGVDALSTVTDGTAKFDISNSVQPLDVLERMILGEDRMDDDDDKTDGSFGDETDDVSKSAGMPRGWSHRGAMRRKPFSHGRESGAGPTRRLTVFTGDSTTDEEYSIEPARHGMSRTRRAGGGRVLVPGSHRGSSLSKLVRMQREIAGGKDDASVASMELMFNHILCSSKDRLMPDDWA